MAGSRATPTRQPRLMMRWSPRLPRTNRFDPHITSTRIFKVPPAVTRLVFFCGHAGTGKTTVARRLLRPLMEACGAPFCLLDKDTLYDRTGAVTMQALTGDPNDRDSPIFLQHLRDPEYRGLINTARDNLALGVSVL